MSEQRFASVDTGFSLTADAQRNALCFAIKGSGIGFGAWFGLIFAGVFFGAILTVLCALIGGNADRWGADDFFNTWFTMIALVMVCAFLWNRSRSQMFQFDITDVDVQTPDGNRYARSDISETLLRNKGTIIHNSQANVSSHSSTLVVGTGMVGGAVAAGHAVGNVAGAMGQALGQTGKDVTVLVKNSVAKRSYEVCIRHGRKVIPLARYLREDDAIALFNKIAEVL